MSMPIYVLMTQNMMDAIDFVFTKVLNGVEEIIDVWLKARKIHHLSRAMNIVAHDGWPTKSNFFSKQGIHHLSFS